MKILHITKDDFSGAGLCCVRIHKSLCNTGIESRVLVERKRSKENGVYQYGHHRLLLYRAWNRICRIIHLYIGDYNKVVLLSEKYRTTFTLPTSILDLSNHKLVKEADIIHLHWINGYVDYSSFFKKVNKPIVWTLHDENLFYGISHYSDSVRLDDPIERKYYNIKTDALRGLNNLNIVFLSKYFYDKFYFDPIIKNASKCVINNSVDCANYLRHTKKDARKKMGIRDDLIVLLFIAYNITDARKGLDILIDAVKRIGDSNIRILAVGNNSNFKGDSIVLTTGLISDPKEMSEIISCADFFVMPSFQEAFAQTPLEAMACGIPAVVFPVSGTEELINEENGIRCNGFTVDDLIDGLKKAFNRMYNSEKIRNDVENRFSPQNIAAHYIHLYNQIIEK